MDNYSDYLRDPRMTELYKGCVEPLLADISAGREVYFYDELNKSFTGFADPGFVTEIFAGIVLENQDYLNKSYNLDPLYRQLWADFAENFAKAYMLSTGSFGSDPAKIKGTGSEWIRKPDEPAAAQKQKKFFIPIWNKDRTKQVIAPVEVKRTKKEVEIIDASKRRGHLLKKED